MINPLKRRHLDDTALAEIWTAKAVGEQAAADHLDECASCRARYSALAATLDGWRDDALAEADEAFTAERLAQQQSHIFRRLEAMERPARVIAFPRFSRPAGAQHSNARRWIAAAAVAGLVIGLAGGQMLDLRRRTGATSFATSTSAARMNGDRVPSYTPVSLSNDEAALLEMGNEAATYAHMPEPLRALDGLTPRARDYVAAR